MLKKTQDKYKKVIHSLKTKHKEEIKHLEISIKKEQEEKMKASMLEYENTISELRMNENMAQQKLTEWMNKIKELETKNEELIKSKEKLEEEELNNSNSSTSGSGNENEEKINELNQKIETLKSKNVELEKQITITS